MCKRTWGCTKASCGCSCTPNWRQGVPESRKSASSRWTDRCPFWHFPLPVQAHFLLISLHLHPPQFDQDETDKRNNVFSSEAFEANIQRVLEVMVSTIIQPPRAQYRVFFLVKKTDFWLKNHFSAKRENARFSVTPARTGSVVLLGHFFYGPDDSPEFRWNRTKIKGSCPSNVGMAKNGQKQGWAPKNDP